MKLFLDTHVIIWLYIRDQKPFSQKALNLIDTYDIFIPSISILEMQFLYEIKKLYVNPIDIITELRETISLLTIHTDSADLIQNALPLNWTRDPFDRLIVAETIYHGATLLTKDEVIRKNFNNAVW